MCRKRGVGPSTKSLAMYRFAQLNGAELFRKRPLTNRQGYACPARQPLPVRLFILDIGPIIRYKCCRPFRSCSRDRAARRVWRVWRDAATNAASAPRNCKERKAHGPVAKRHVDRGSVCRLDQHRFWCGNRTRAGFRQRRAFHNRQSDCADRCRAARLPGDSHLQLGPRS